MKIHHLLLALATSLLVGCVQTNFLPLPGGKASVAVAAEATVDQDYSFRTADGLTLKAKLTLPQGARGPVPVVVFIGGSGPWDADYRSAVPDSTGTGTHSIQIMPIENLAKRCAANGMAFVRYAKRGISPGGSENSAWGTSQLHNLKTDANQLLIKIKADRRLDGTRIALVGHSEGTAIATWVAGHDPQVRAFAFMGLMRRNLKDLISYQIVDSRIDRIFDLFDNTPKDGGLDANEIQVAITKGANFPDWQQADLDHDGRLSKSELASYMGLTQSFQTWLSQLSSALPEQSVTQKNGVRDMPAGWWMEHFAHQSVGDAWTTITTPVLVLQGKADANTPYATEAIPFEAQLSAQKHRDHKLIGFEGLTHEFLDAQGQSHADSVFSTLVPWLGSRLVK